MSVILEGSSIRQKESMRSYIEKDQSFDGSSSADAVCLMPSPIPSFQCCALLNIAKAGNGHKTVVSML